jgi:hypothetical protein
MNISFKPKNLNNTLVVRICGSCKNGTVRIHATPRKVHVPYVVSYLATTASHNDGDGCSDSRHSCSRLAPSSAQWAAAASAQWAVAVSAQWAVAVSAQWAVAVSAQ